MNNKIYFIKKTLIIFIFFISFIKNLSADTIQKFEISGNDRISKETIIMFSNIKIGENVDNNILNKVLKSLYATDYFENVEISFNNNVIQIKVIENPIIQSVIINGIKKDKIYENIKNITSKTEKYPFIESKINEQMVLMKNILKSYGYYFVELDTSYVENSNNSLDLIYDFKLGPIAKIKNIKFIGNKVYRDSTLRNVIISEESKFWKFITRNKFLNSNRINLDNSRLTNFYKNNGYFNANIKSSTALINEDNQFDIIFNIDAGEKFYFDKIEIINQDSFSLENINNFVKRFDKLKGRPYSIKKLTNLIDDINYFTLRNDFVFINADYDEIIKNNNQIDIKIKFNEIEKEFVERINIFGNFITDEKVVRNSLIIDEGDALNKILFDKSIKNIKSKNIFKSVNYNISENNDSKKIIDITVEEKATGEIFAGAGTGTTGSSFSAGIKENNYLGLGIKLDTELNVTEDSVKGKFSVLNPNYKNSDKKLKTVIESSSTDFLSTSGYKTDRTGLTLGTEFEQMNDLFVNFELSNFYEDLETSSNANSIVKKQEGSYFENLITYSLSYNKLNQNFQPSDGFLNRFSQTLPIISDDVSIENSFTSDIYHSVNENLILSAKFLIKTVNSLDDNVRISKRVYIPSSRLKGFESGKIGPKDGSQYIGGNYASSLNLNSTLPNILFENENIDFNFFIDMANVWEVDYDSSLDSNKIRSSTGVAVNWFSPVGPLTFSYAIPISEANTDVTENFRFQIGTSF